MKLPGISKERAWETVSTGATNYPPKTRLLIDVLADSYQLSSLDPGSQYKDPGKGDTNGLKCGCNTVIYRSVHSALSFCTLDGNRTPPSSLYSGCTACQNAPTNTWAQWSGNCDAVYVAQ